jgi:hypothetical protein
VVPGKICGRPDALWTAQDAMSGGCAPAGRAQEDAAALPLAVEPEPAAAELLDDDLAAADPEDSFDEDDEDESDDDEPEDDASEDDDESELDEVLDAAASLDALPFPFAAAARLSVR